MSDERVVDPNATSEPEEAGRAEQPSADQTDAEQPGAPDLARQELADELNSIRALGENLHG